MKMMRRSITSRMPEFYGTRYSERIRKRNGRKGQSLIEFALVIPILLLLLLGVVEFGWFINVHLRTANAAREGVRAAAVGQSTSQITARVNNNLSGLTATSVTCEYSTDGGSSWTTMSGSNVATAGDLVRVTVVVTHSQLTNLVPALNGATVTKAVTMRREAT